MDKIIKSLDYILDKVHKIPAGNTKQNQLRGDDEKDQKRKIAKMEDSSL